MGRPVERRLEAADQGEWRMGKGGEPLLVVWSSLKWKVLLDQDAQRADPERPGWHIRLWVAHVEIGENLAAERLMEGVDVALLVGVVEGELALVAVQFHPDPLEVPERRLRPGRVGGPAHLAVGALQAVDVPEARAGVVVEVPPAAAPLLGHAHAPVREPAQVHLPRVGALGEAPGAQDAGGRGEALRVVHQ